MTNKPTNQNSNDKKKHIYTKTEMTNKMTDKTEMTKSRWIQK